MNSERIRALRDGYRDTLLNDIIPFWERHGIDRRHGGFLTCLGRDGAPYSDDKSVWFQGRGTWTFATLHQRVEPRLEWLAAAAAGYAFLHRHCFDSAGKMYFLVTRDGRPLRMRRYLFSEVFGILGCAAYAKAARDDEARRRAIALFDRFLHARAAVPPKWEATRPMKALSPVMCLLNVAEEMRSIDDDARYDRIIDDCIEEIFAHFVKPDLRCVLEVVGPEGQPLDTPEGRTLNPGHAIECAWFIWEVARRRNDHALVRRALPLLDWSWERGWDPQFGGLYSFVDHAGQPPTQLEHDMKLWWPHCEALVATLMAYRLTGEARYAEMFERTHAWTMRHFPDPQFGEWYGYLHRDGTVSTPLKGGVWKGPFHIPRALLYCWKLLEEMA